MWLGVDLHHRTEYAKAYPEHSIAEPKTSDSHEQEENDFIILQQ